MSLLEDSGLENFLGENYPEIKSEIFLAETVQNDIKLEGPGQALLDCGNKHEKVPGYEDLGKRYEDGKLLTSNQDRMLERLKALLSNKEMLSMNETMPT